MKITERILELFDEHPSIPITLLILCLAQMVYWFNFGFYSWMLK